MRLLLVLGIKYLQVCIKVCIKSVHMHVHTFRIIKKSDKSNSYVILPRVHVHLCILAVHAFLFLKIKVLQNRASVPYYVGESIAFPMHSRHTLETQ